MSPVRNLVFIAGTDTGVGKTVFTGLLACHLLKKGHRVVTQKWVETGCVNFSQDIRTHLRLMRKTIDEYASYLPSMTPYIFKYVSSPHLASRLEKRSIRVSKIKKSLKNLSENFDFVIVEGSGGILVPLGGKRLLADVIRGLRLPVVLIAENRLGAINHTLLSVEALKSRGIKIVGIIFNTTAKGNGNTLVLKDNPRIVKRLTRVEVLGVLPYANAIDTLHRHFALIGDRTIARLWKI
ncbi:MAG: dethiobiotin synthase [Candidatus Omnitrophica bacterium]|nr:dethiobiotin synthase [Candidatus Omnitrophota bacterium]